MAAKKKAPAKKAAPKAKKAKALKTQPKTGIRTWLAFVLDESGSMSSLRAAAISAFNEFLAEQKKLVDDTRLTLTCFNTSVRKIYSATPLADCAELTEKTYIPNGMTALYDAINTAVADIEAQMQPGDRALVTVFTDGLENSSVEMTREKVAELIRAHEAKGNWTFAYMGSHKDTWAAAESIGIRTKNVAQVDPNNLVGGVQAMAASTRGMRGSAVMSYGADSGLYDTSASNVTLTAEDRAKLNANLKVKQQ